MMEMQIYPFPFFVDLVQMLMQARWLMSEYV